MEEQFEKMLNRHKKTGAVRIPASVMSRSCSEEGSPSFLYKCAKFAVVVLLAAATAAAAYFLVRKYLLKPAPEPQCSLEEPASPPRPRAPSADREDSAKKFRALQEKYNPPAAPLPPPPARAPVVPPPVTAPATAPTTAPTMAPRTAPPPPQAPVNLQHSGTDEPSPRDPQFTPLEELD